MNIRALAQRQQCILLEIAAIHAMKKGSVTHQRTVVKQTGKKTPDHNGPYPVLTWKEDGKTRSMRLKSDEEIRWAEQAIGNYRRFASLCREYEELGEQAALAQRQTPQTASVEAEKKGLNSRRTRTRK